jgi:hypothetical protein
VSVAATLLIYLVIPLAIVLVLAALVFLPGGRRRPRWKSGQPWNHEPVWYEPHPEASGGHGEGHGEEHGEGSAALESGGSHAALTSGAETAAAPAASAGPLGGARGTW